MNKIMRYATILVTFIVWFVLISLPSQAQLRTAQVTQSIENLLSEATRAEERGDVDAALEKFYAACFRHSGLACFRAGSLHEYRDEIEEAEKLYWYSCHYDHSLGCRAKADILAERAKSQKMLLASAENYYQRGCALRDQVSCEELSRIRLLDSQ